VKIVYIISTNLYISFNISFELNLIIPIDSPCNLCVILESHPFIAQHTAKVFQIVTFISVRQIDQISNIVSFNSAIMLANSLVSTCLDYCNLLLYNLLYISFTCLQRVQRSTARFVCFAVTTEWLHHYTTSIVPHLYCRPY